jgi:hypothetical protein
MWLNLYDHQVVQRKLNFVQKMQKGPICEFFAKEIENWGYLKNSVFLSRPFWKFLILFCFIPIKISHKWMRLNFYYYYDFQKKARGGGG